MIKEKDLKERTKQFALKIIRTESGITKGALLEELLVEADELVAIFTTIGKKSK